MKTQTKPTYLASFLIQSVVLFIIMPCNSQDNSRQVVSFEDYIENFIEPDEAYLATLEEWQNVIGQWLENPICINNEEADLLAEYKVISLYQLNKLKEYRLIYSDLLSVFELAYIEGWDFQTADKVKPLVTTDISTNARNFNKFSYRSFRQSLVLKTSFNSEKSKGYQEDTSSSGPYYAGSPARLALRYDLEFRNRIAIGLRMEKDPGEPWLVPYNNLHRNIKTPDLFSGYMHFKKLGPVQSFILGNYRVNFGYGLNLSGGQSGIKGRNGMAGMADRISPQGSVSETGFLRGAAIRLASGRFSLVCFASHQHLDGNSILSDSLTGKPSSFSSIDQSGLHRSAGELEGRKTIIEKAAGGFVVYRNNWLKTGIFAMYNQFNASVRENNRPYARFNLHGKENLVNGFSATIWLPKFQFLAETSMSRNKNSALLAGTQFNPVPGVLIAFIYRKFDVDYQNWKGAGFISAGQNSGETGIQFKFRLELPRKYLVEILADESQLQWVSYDLLAPSRQKEINIMAEKAWPQSQSLCLSFRYMNSRVKNPENSYHICHLEDLNQFKLRLEGRIEAAKGIRLKSRIEYNFVEHQPPGWLIFQDFEFFPDQVKVKIWLRTCFFDIKDYGSRIYAYENDVLYDFSSFMHYGKGLRSIFMLKLSPFDWIDLWIRLSTVYYTNRHIGSGWDEIEGSRQNEIELQARLKWPS